MKVLIVNKFLYPRGGDAVVALATGALLAEHGHEVVYWGMRSANNQPFAHNDLFVDEVDLMAIKSPLAAARAAGAMLYAREPARKLRALLGRIGRPDIAHLHNFAHQISPSILPVLQQQGVPCIMTMHDYKMVCAAYTLRARGRHCQRCAGGAHWHCFAQRCVKDSAAKSFLNMLEMYLHHQLLHSYDRIGLFIAPSEFLRRKVQEMGMRAAIAVLPNFITAGTQRPAAAGRQRPVIGYCGRLAADKGLTTLITAMRGLPQVQLMIVGDGPLRAALEEQARRQTAGSIVFTGHLSGAALQKVFAEFRCLVVPSEWPENHPRVILEAFSAGIPVIAADIGGIPELVRDGQTGLLTPPADAAALGRAITRILADEDAALRMSARARRWVEQELNSTRHYEQLLALYQRVISGFKQC